MPRQSRWIKSLTVGKLPHNEWCLPFGVQFQFSKTRKSYYLALKCFCFQVTFQARYYQPFVIPEPIPRKRNASGRFVS